MTLLKEKTNNKTLRGKGRRLDSERRCEGEHGGGREGKGTQSILSRQCERGRRTKITHPTAGRGVDWMAFSLPLTSLGDVKECSGTLNWTDYKEPLSLCYNGHDSDAWSSPSQPGEYLDTSRAKPEFIMSSTVDSLRTTVTHSTLLYALVSRPPFVASKLEPTMART